MRVLKILVARSIWQLPITDINPQGKAIDADLIALLKKTYQFQKFPTSAFDYDSETKSIFFAGGKFKAGEDRYIAVGLAIYKDGLVANTESSTKDSDTFLDEVLRLVVKELSLVHPGPIRKRLYLSEMDVRLDRSMNLLNPKLAQLASRISELRPEAPNTAFEFSGVSFLPQPEMQATIAGFHLERKINTDWSENRYYTKAPVQTDAHLKLLEEFEALLV